MPARVVAFLVLVLVTFPETVARPAERCASSCRDQVAACRRTECAAQQGIARRDCRERCAARLGCPTRIRTLAYVVTRCRGAGGKLVGSQELRIRRGDCDPTTVVGFENPDAVDDPAGLCGILANTRLGVGSGVAGVFQRLGVTPDGSGVVFEVTNAFQLVGQRTPLTPEQMGFFYVRADGSGLRRLGPPSADSTYRVGFRAGQVSASFNNFLAFSPSGRLVGYTDRGVAPDGSPQDQVFTLDVRRGTRTQVTRLPAAPVDVADRTSREVSEVFFVDERTIQFDTRVFDELGGAPYTIGTDGSGLRRGVRLDVPPEVSRDPGTPTPVFGVTGRRSRITPFRFLATAPVNTDPTWPDAPVVEVFRVKGNEALQLTHYRRVDTAPIGEHGGLRFAPRGPRVLFQASIDPFGLNPFGNCQIFSIDHLGNDLRQLTRFDVGAPSVAGCYFGAYTGCAFYAISEDPVTKWVVFYSNCDPLGTNPNGSAVFAMRRDGAHVRQLTHTAGVLFGPGDAVEAELPGPIAYSTTIP